MRLRISVIHVSLVLLTTGLMLIGGASDTAALGTCLLPHELYLPVVFRDSSGGGPQRPGEPDPLYADFNGDGCADLAIGVPFEDIDAAANAGAVNILYGAAAGLTSDGAQVWYQDSPGVPGGSESDDYFGTALAAGDFDDDGYWDLAIGAPAEDINGIPNAGAVNILYGSAAGLSATRAQLWQQDTPGVPSGNEDGDRFGQSLAAGDFDDDGYWDLAIGVPEESFLGVLFAGATEILYGSAAGLSTNGAQEWNQDTLAVPGDNEDSDNFGWTLVAGDFDGDDYWDLAIGIPAEDFGLLTNPGAVIILYGSTTGLSADGAQEWNQDSPGVPDSNEFFDRFGIALAPGDFDGDGYWDLAIGAPTEYIDGFPDAGTVTLLYGSAAGLSTDGIQFWNQDSPDVPGVIEGGEEFGSALAAGDFDDDGYWDLAIGIPEEGINGISRAGAVTVLHGSPAGLSADGAKLWHQSLPGVPGSDEEDDHFGQALAVGDFDGSGAWDLAIGIPDKHINFPGVGAVNVLYGTAVGLSSLGSQGWTQDTPGVPGLNEADDRFGLSLR